MTEKEKMEKGELYDAAIPELIEQLLSTRDKIFELNHLRPSQLEEREKLIREIIGTTPEKFIIISPFFATMGITFTWAKISLPTTIALCSTRLPSP